MFRSIGTVSPSSAREVSTSSTKYADDQDRFCSWPVRRHTHCNSIQQTDECARQTFVQKVLSLLHSDLIVSNTKEADAQYDAVRHELHDARDDVDWTAHHVDVRTATENHRGLESRHRLRRGSGAAGGRLVIRCNL
jgi:hypothetical protein